MYDNIFHNAERLIAVHWVGAKAKKCSPNDKVVSDSDRQVRN